jgi:hypothetical protein
MSPVFFECWPMSRPIEVITVSKMAWRSGLFLPLMSLKARDYPATNPVLRQPSNQ